MSENIIINRDCLAALRDLPDESVNSCVTSPPYYALRDYGMDAQIGREDSPEEYICRLVLVFREVRRVLTADGTLWLNIADTYSHPTKSSILRGTPGGTGNKGGYLDPKNPKGRNGQSVSLARRASECKQKDMIGIPWLLAFALRADGWYLRSDIIWYKANPMPESCKDRPSRCYEHVFLLTKSKKYYYDALAIAEPIAEGTAQRYKGGRSASSKYAEEIPGQGKVQKLNAARAAGTITDADISPVRNARDVWHINTVPYKGGHFAAYPPKLAERCILAGCPRGGIVLDPFFGSGTTGLAAVKNDRRYIGIELNAEYCELAKERIGGAKLRASRKSQKATACNLPMKNGQATSLTSISRNRRKRLTVWTRQMRQFRRKRSSSENVPLTKRRAKQRCGFTLKNKTSRQRTRRASTKAPCAP